MNLKRVVTAAVLGLSIHSAKAQDGPHAASPSMEFTGISYHRTANGGCEAFANIRTPDGQERRSNLISVNQALQGLRNFPLRPGQTPASRAATLQQLERAQRELERKSGVHFICDTPTAPTFKG